MPATARFAREEMHVLADGTEVRIVILRHQCKAEGTVVPNNRQMRQLGEGGVSKRARIPEGEIQERHGLRLGGLLERGRGSRRRNPSRSCGRTSRSAVH